jgi:hypothetical protein
MELNPRYLEHLYEHRMIEAAAAERQRIINLIQDKTRHEGQTHYEGMNCFTCRIVNLIERSAE